MMNHSTDLLGEIFPIESGASGDETPASTETIVSSVRGTIISVPFWSEDPEGWFMLMEQQFESAKVRTDSEKFMLITKELDQQTRKLASATLQTTRAGNRYPHLKKAILSRMSIPYAERLRSVLTEMELGDKKPSWLLSEMLAKGKDHLTEDSILVLWKERLPASLQAILAGTDDTSDKLGALADRIHSVVVRTQPPPQLAPVSRRTSNPPLTGEPTMRQVMDAVADISRRLAAIETRQRGRNPHRSNSRRRNGRSPSHSGFCFYHERYGSKAHRCENPCSFSGN